MSTIVVAPTGGTWDASTGSTWVLGTAPTAADDAVGDLLSGAVTIAPTAVGRSFDCTSGTSGSYTNTVTHGSGAALVLGDATAGVGGVALKLSAGMTYTVSNAASSAISFNSTSATQQTVDYAGHAGGSFTFNGAGSNYAIVSPISPKGTNSNLTVARGTIHIDGASDNSGLAHSFGVLSLTGSNTRTVNLGNTTLTLSAVSGIAVNSAATGLTLNPGTSTIILSDTSGNSKTFTGSGLTWNNLQTPSGTGGVILGGGATFNRITAPLGGKIALGSTSVTVITATSGSNNFNNGANTVTMVQQSTGATIKFSHQFSGDYLNLTNIVADPTGVIPAYAGTHSVDGGGNTNWVFTAPPSSSGHPLIRRGPSHVRVPGK